MKLLVLGNCQARPVTQILARAAGMTPLDPIVLHLATRDQAEDHRDRMTEADLILAQFTNPAFQPDHLAAGTVARDWPDKTLIWPNLFYSGQQPFLRYLTHPDYGRLLGPFEAVHDISLLQDWYTERCGRATSQMDEAAYIAHIRAQSLVTLQQREMACDVAISDLIEAHESTRQLFFTFNHPTRWLMEALCVRIAKKIGISLPQPEDQAEPLGRVVAPSTWTGQDDLFQGYQVSFLPDGVISAKGRQSYTPDSLRETAFRCFDHMAPHLDFSALRLTPRLDVDPVPLLSDMP